MMGWTEAGSWGSGVSGGRRQGFHTSYSSPSHPPLPGTTCVQMMVTPVYYPQDNLPFFWGEAANS